MHPSTPACEQSSTSCLTLSNCRTKKLPFIHTRVRSNISQISTLDPTLQRQGNKLAFFMQLYQLHTVDKLATRQCLCDHIGNTVFVKTFRTWTSPRSITSVTKCSLTSMCLVRS